MEKLKLILPTMEYAGQIMAYKEEMKSADSSMDGCGALRHCETAEEWLGHKILCKPIKRPNIVPVFSPCRVPGRCPQLRVPRRLGRGDPAPGAAGGPGHHGRPCIYPERPGGVLPCDLFHSDKGR